MAVNNTYTNPPSIINTPGGGNTTVQYNKNGTFAGDNGLKYNESLKELSVQGNINVGGWVKGKIYTNKYNFFLTGGNAGQVLTTDGTGNLSWTDQTGGGGSSNYSNSNVSAYLSTFTGNISAGNIKTNNLLYANGVAWNFAGTYSNSNVANYLPTFTGNISAGNIRTDNLLYANGVAWNFAGTYSNSNVANYLPTYTGNITGGNVSVTGQLRGATVYVTSTGTAINASQGNILTNEVTGTKVNLLSGAYTTSIVSGATSSYTLTLPTTAGTTGQVLTTNGSGALSWTTVSSNSVGSELVNGDNTFALQSDGNVVFSGDTGGVNRGLVWDYGAVANGVNSQIRQDGAGLTVRAYTTDGGGANGYSATVNIVTNQDATQKEWVFDGDGNLRLPGNIQSKNISYEFSGNITDIQSFTYPTPPLITIDEETFEGPTTGQVTISNLTPLTGTLQANGTWYYESVDINQFTLYTDAALTQPVDTSSWTAYQGGGGSVVSVNEYADFTIQGGNVTVNGNGNAWTFDNEGRINIPAESNSFGTGRIQSANGYPTLLAYGSGEEHGGPELDWMNTDDPNSFFGNSSVLRNTLYINDNGLYIGMNENSNTNAVQASWRFDRYGALNLPSGNASQVVRGQILSDNENGFINLDVQFNVEPGKEGGVRLGTGATKPVDIRAGSNEWRFDSDSSLTVPGVIKSIGSYQYRGFHAVLNQISGDDPSINQIVLSRSSSISGSNPTTDTDDDNFIVTGINGSNITAIVNLYGTSTSVPLDLESLFYFIRNYIDVVLYNGNTQRTSISDIQTAFAANEAELLGPENFTSGTIVTDMNFNAIQAIFQVNAFTHTGSGTDAVFFFDLDDPIGEIDYNTAEWNSSDCVVPGTGYQVGDTITVPGTELGGAAPADNMTITVGAINGSGGIVDFSVTGTMSQASYEQNFVKRYIYDGTSDIQDQGNFLGTDVSRCVFTAYTDSNSNLIVTSVAEGGLYPYMVFYEPTNQTYPMVMWQTDGVDEGGTGTYVTGGYNTISNNLPSRTYTAYGIPYGVGETISGGSGTAWGGGTYGSMVGSNGNGIFSMVSLGGTASTVSYAGNTGSDGDGTKAAISPFPLGAEPQPLYLESSNNTWTFGTDGNLIVPGNINAVATGSFPINTTIGDITTGGTNVYVTLNNISFPGPITGKVAISGAVGTVQVNQTWWFQAAEVSDIQLFTDSGLTTPANGTTWLPYQGGGTAVSVTYDNLVIGAGVLSLGNPNRKWTIVEDGNLVAEHSTATIVGDSGLAIEVTEGNALTNVINVPVNQTYTGAWSTATYSNNSGTGRIDIVGSTGNLRRFVQLRMQNANQGTAVLTINNSTNKLTYNGFEYTSDGTFTIYVVQSPGDSVTVTTMTLDAVMRNVMELNDDNSQLNIHSYSGWPVNITSGWQGDVNINAGDDIYLNAGDKKTTDSTGGQIDINAGNGGDADTQDSSGNGGAINIRGGDGGVASNAFSGGNGGTTFITGGDGGFAHAAGLQNAGDGGSLILNAGPAGSNDGNISLGSQGGNVEIQAGYATGSFVGGNVSITAGQGGANFGSGNITLATQASDHTTNYAWNFDSTGNLTLPTISLGEGVSEQAIIRSQRKIISPLHYSVIVNDITPTVVYTGSSSLITSLKTTFSLLHVGFGREMFDVSAMAAGANVLYSVSNRLNGTGEPDTSVSVDYNGSGQLEVTFTVNSGAFTTWVTYDSTEFGTQTD